MSAEIIDAVEPGHVLSRIEWVHGCIEVLVGAAYNECELLHSSNGDPESVAKSADRVMMLASIAGEYFSELGVQTSLLCERITKAGQPLPAK